MSLLKVISKSIWETLNSAIKIPTFWERLGLNQFLFVKYLEAGSSICLASYKQLFNESG